MFHRSREINWIKEHFQASSLVTTRSQKLIKRFNHKLETLLLAGMCILRKMKNGIGKTQNRVIEIGKMTWVDDVPVRDVQVRGTRLLYDFYHRCNIAVCEPAGFEEAKLDKKMDGCNEGGATHDQEKRDMAAC